jgi:hypothetical protein
MDQVPPRAPRGHSIAALGCPLHSAAHLDRFHLLLEEVAAPHAGLSVDTPRRGSEE